MRNSVFLPHPQILLHLHGLPDLTCLQHNRLGLLPGRHVNGPIFFASASTLSSLSRFMATSQPCNRAARNFPTTRGCSLTIFSEVMIELATKLTPNSAGLKKRTCSSFLASLSCKMTPWLFRYTGQSAELLSIISQHDGLISGINPEKTASLIRLPT